MHAATTTLRAELEALLSEPVADAQRRELTAFDQAVGPCGQRLVLFGAGNMGRRVLARLRRDGIEPLAFADNQQKTAGRTLDGLPVLPPAVAARQYGAEAAFVVTIYNHFHDYSATRRQLEGLGCRRVVPVIPLRWKYHETFLPYYRDDLPHKVLLQADAIRQAFDLWSDERSQREFVAHVEWRLHGDSGRLPARASEPPYFPGDLFRLGPAEFFVDAGAYDGDTIRSYLESQGTAFQRIVALEPDPGNFGRLKACVSGLPAEVQARIELQPLAVGAKQARLRFAAGEETSSALSERGAIEVECVRLDDLLAGRQPTYIKMDIEGAELDALAGGAHLISTFGPLLAICVYHQQDHLWQIPLYIHSLLPNHRFFLKTHLEDGWELVCYAAPPERLNHRPTVPNHAP